MKSFSALRFSFLLLMILFCFAGSGNVLWGQGSGDLVISGVIDGPLSMGLPKAVEFYVLNDIADLSVYGFGSANNGGGSDGQEFTFPGISVTAGTYIYVASEATGFNSFFGFNPDFTSSAANINGDDAIELFFNGSVSDVFGDINTDGTGQPWEYMDGWAYRNNDTGPDGSTFVLGNWYFSGPNALDGETTNATAATPFPIGTYTFPITLLSFNGSYRDGEVLLNWATGVEVNNDYVLVERSADGVKYEAIGRVEGKGTTYTGHEYAFTDAAPLPGINYYRLHQVDFDGSAEYHGPIVVKTEGGLVVYPTLAETALYVEYSGQHKNLEQPLQYRLCNLQGRELQSGTLIPTADRQEIAVSNLPRGMYVLHWQQAGTTGAFRFVKE